MVTLTATQVETFFGELEYIEPRLKALGVIVADEGGWPGAIAKPSGGSLGKLP